MTEAVETENTGNPKCPACLAVQEGESEVIATLKVHACEACNEPFVITGRQTHFTTFPANIPLE